MNQSWGNEEIRGNTATQIVASQVIMNKQKKRLREVEKNKQVSRDWRKYRHWLLYTELTKEHKEPHRVSRPSSGFYEASFLLLQSHEISTSLTIPWEFLQSASPTTYFSLLPATKSIPQLEEETGGLPLDITRGIIWSVQTHDESSNSLKIPHCCLMIYFVIND